MSPILNLRHHRMLHAKVAEATQFMSIMHIYSKKAFLLYFNNALAADPKLRTLIPYCMINFNTSK